ncbi:MAG: hypothetical protein C4542_04590 [Dehalococcoidia bacterium]|nr:MAG: hypothetical protein C4542_04590 [Dehalococcoidia bacterium]
MKGITFLLALCAVFLFSCSVPQTVTISKVMTTTAVNTAKPPKTYSSFLLESSLTFTAASGDRVVCEIQDSQINKTALFFIKDPYGNTVVESARKTVKYYYSNDMMTTSTQQYPWTYSFFATSDGQYTLGISNSENGWRFTSVTITVYPK